MLDRAPASARPLDLGDDMEMEGDDKRPRMSAVRSCRAQKSYNHGEMSLSQEACRSDWLQHCKDIDVETDDGRQQLYSCVANGKLYNDHDVHILALVLKGVDITEIYSPERVTKLCRKYNLIAEDSFDFRTGYDLSDPATQARVIHRIQQSQPTLVIGSPPCTLFSRLQKLNLHVHGQAWADKY